MTQGDPLISICIPAYNQVCYLKILLNTILDQTFDDYEVIISDDSTTSDVYDLIKSIDNNKFFYFHNDIPLGSPANWNNAIDKARGKYIKIMHHDDWFLKPTSLEVFIQKIEQDNLDFVFSSSFVEFENGKKYINSIHQDWLTNLIKSPEILLEGNLIGAPTAVIYRRDLGVSFDNNIKWLVDLEFYYRIISVSKKTGHISEALVLTYGANDRISDHCVDNFDVQINEHLYVLKKHKLLNKRGLRIAYTVCTNFGCNKYSNVKQVITKTNKSIRFSIYFLMRSSYLFRGIKKAIRLSSKFFKKKQIKEIQDHRYIWNTSVPSNCSIGDYTEIINCNFSFSNKVGKYCYLDNVSLGDLTYMSIRCTIQNAIIGKYCSIAQDVSIGLGKHPIDSFVSTHPAFYSDKKQAGYTFSSNSKFEENVVTQIENDVWIGANVVILDGVKIASGVVIAAGSIVTKDVPPYAIVAGIPAKIIKYRFNEEQINRLLELKWWDKESSWYYFNNHEMEDINKLMSSLSGSY